MTLASDGFAIVHGLLDGSAVLGLTATLARARGEAHAARNLLSEVPEVRRLAASPAVRALVEPVLGTACVAVRGILFDKTAAANWKVAWHQDLVVAVRERREVASFGPWSVKAGVVHAQAPATVLAQMLAVRIHLDDCTTENGPLRVLPGTHLLGCIGAQGDSEQQRKSAYAAHGQHEGKEDGAPRELGWQMLHVGLRDWRGARCKRGSIIAGITLRTDAAHWQRVPSAHPGEGSRPPVAHAAIRGTSQIRLCPPRTLKTPSAGLQGERG